jgi:hypothetical protein
MPREVISGISASFEELSQSQGQVAHVLLTRSPLIHTRRCFTVRLACVKHAASVRPEPGSNSPLSLLPGHSPGNLLTSVDLWQDFKLSACCHHQRNPSQPAELTVDGVKKIGIDFRHAVEFSRSDCAPLLRPWPLLRGNSTNLARLRLGVKSRCVAPLARPGGPVSPSVVSRSGHAARRETLLWDLCEGPTGLPNRDFLAVRSSLAVGSENSTRRLPPGQIPSG